MLKGREVEKGIRRLEKSIRRLEKGKETRGG